MYDVLVHDLPISEVIAHREIDIAVASIDLAGAEIAMSTKIGRERSLEKALKEVHPDYDYICIDTPPSLGLLTINALTASNKVIVPVQCEYLSMRGLVQLQSTLTDDPGKPEPERPHRGHPADHVRLPHPACAGGGFDSRGELRGSRFQVPHPQGRQIRRSAGTRR